MQNMCGCPLKIYPTGENTMMIIYTNPFFTEDFKIKDITHTISKSDFFKAIERYRETGVLSLNNEDNTLTLSINDDSFKLKIESENATTVEEGHDKDLNNWLLSMDPRKSRRIDTYIPATIHSGNECRYGVILDVSETGFKVSLSTGISRDHTVLLSIVEENTELLDINCIIKRVLKDEDNYVYGLQISDISEDDLQKIKALIEKEKTKK